MDGFILNLTSVNIISWKGVSFESLDDSLGAMNSYTTFSTAALGRPMYNCMKLSPRVDSAINTSVLLLKWLSSSLILSFACCKQQNVLPGKFYLYSCACTHLHYVIHLSLPSIHSLTKLLVVSKPPSSLSRTFQCILQCMSLQLTCLEAVLATNQDKFILKCSWFSCNEVSRTNS